MAGGNLPRRPLPWGWMAAAFFAFLVVTGAATVWQGRRASASSGAQPIAFNHRKHVKDLELACSTCHAFYEKEAFSGLPGADTCAACHSEPQGKSAEEQKLVALVKAGAPLPWVSLFRQPAHVFYSHRRHVVAAKIDCPVCHGAIAASTSPPRSVRKLAMQDCIDCHRRAGVSTDCTACHR